MDFVLPTISIDFSWFAGLGSQPLWYIMWVLFIYGGWVPVLIALWKGGQLIWLNWRQGKFAQDIDYILLAMDVPKGDEQTPKAVENIFTHLNGTYSGPTLKEKWWDGKIQITFSFELISIGGYIQFLVRTPTKHRDLIEAAIFSQYPDAEIIEVEDYTKDAPK
ncbi:MAG: hypothetical protein HQ536_03135, partial [Parcubacteria group bacterium]|nr:hypothetical protein [Parcubacteria group bacterium]